MAEAATDDIPEVETGNIPPLETDDTPKAESVTIPRIAPVVFDKPQLDAFTSALSGSPAGPAATIARQLVGEVSQDAPGLFDYNSLRNGTAKYFNLLPETVVDNDNVPIKDLPASRRALSDSDIISLFAVDTEGNPIEAGTFLGGAKREVLPQTSASGGMYAGARLGASLPLPPQAKLAASIGGGILGTISAYLGGSLLTDELLGKERPLLPGTTEAYEQGKTAAGVMAFLPMPFMISKNISFGTADYLSRLAKEGVTTTPRSIRLTQGVEKMLNRAGTAARAAPVETIALEGIMGAGQVYGAGFAERYFPGDPWVRLLSETGFGIGAGVAGAPTTTLLGNAGAIRNWYRDAKEKGFMETAKDVLAGVKRARQGKAVSRIYEIVEAEELRNARYENVAEEAIQKARDSGITNPSELDKIGKDAEDAFVQQGMTDLINKLASTEMSSLLVDSDGKPIPLTAGAKSGNPALLAIEQSIDQLNGSLGKERAKSSKAARDALRNVILAMAQTGDQKALQIAADLAERTFSMSLGEQLKKASDNVMSAWERVSGDGQRSNIRLSEALYDIVSNQLYLARNKESNLWKAVPEVTVPVSPDDPPEFISKWDELTNLTKEARDFATEGLAPLASFVRRKREELGFAVDENNLPIPATDDLTTKELVEMRSVALKLGKSLDAAGKPGARMAYGMADALLDDALSIPAGPGQGNWRVAYDMARAYSKALNDTFTRSFAGETQSTLKSGAERIAPELLAKRVLQGGNDPTYLRIKQINEIGSFAQREGLEGADQTVGTLLGTTEQILRNARSAAFNPETGEINPVLLQKWIRDNNDVLEMLPRLKGDLENAEKANILLKETTRINQAREAEEKAQLSFYNLMNPVISPDGKRLYGVESPTDAIGLALANQQKFKVRQLNRLFSVVDQTKDPALKEQATTGLKSAILEWAGIKAGITSSKTFSPIQMYDSLYRPLPGSENRISVMEWMLNKKVINEAEAANLKTYLSEMVKFEAAEIRGELGEVVEKAGPILDFYLSITGSAIGTRAQKLLTGGSGGTGSIIAAGRGAATMKRLVEDLPAALQTDVMSELMRNPELLATMMRRPRNDRERSRLAGRLKDILVDLGLRPFRAEAPSVTRETLREREDLDLPEPPREVPQKTLSEALRGEQAYNNLSGQTSGIPTVSAQPNPVPTRIPAMPSPSPIQQSTPAAPAPTPSSGNVDPARYLSVFSSDFGPVGELARQKQQERNNLMGQ